MRNPKGRTLVLVPTSLVVAVGLSACAGTSSAPGQTGAPTSDAAVPPAAEVTTDPVVDAARCMDAQGWEVEVTQGGIQASYPVDQHDAYLSTLDSCYEEVGIDTSPPEPVDAESASRLYDVLVELADCLRSEELPVDEPPSREFFVAGLAESSVPPWHPHDAAAESGDLEAAQAACPAPETW